MMYRIACNSAKIFVSSTGFESFRALVSLLFDLIFQKSVLAHKKGTHVLFWLAPRTYAWHPFVNSFFPTISAWSYECNWLGEIQWQGLRITRYSSKFTKACRFKRQGQNIQQANSTGLCKTNHRSFNTLPHVNLELRNIAQARNLTLRDGSHLNTEASH